MIAGQFRFEVGDHKLDLAPGGSVWMPRGIAHVWGNASQYGGKLLMACQPGGFEKFFDQIGKTSPTETAQITKVMAKLWDGLRRSTAVRPLGPATGSPMIAPSRASVTAENC